MHRTGSTGWSSPAPRRGSPAPTGTAAAPSSSARRERRHWWTRRSIATATPETAPFQELITRYAWGEIWARPGLDRRARSCITLTALVAQGREHELALHVRAALRNGLTPAELEEVFLQCAIYCGVPAANSAFAIAQRVLDEEARE